MGTKWARKEAQTNELAAMVESAAEWLKTHQQAAVWGGMGLAGVLLAAAVSINRYLGSRDESWSQLAIAQSYAYAGLGTQAMSQLKTLSEQHPALPAAGYGDLLQGDILFQQEKYKEAADSYQRVADQPQHKALLPLALTGLALSQEGGGGCKTAVDTAQRFLDVYQDHVLAPQVHASLARCLELLGQTDKAKAAYQRMAFLYPDTYWSDWAKARTKTP